MYIAEQTQLWSHSAVHPQIPARQKLYHLATGLLKMNITWRKPSSLSDVAVSIRICWCWWSFFFIKMELDHNISYMFRIQYYKQTAMIIYNTVNRLPLLYTKLAKRRWMIIIRGFTIPSKCTWYSIKYGSSIPAEQVFLITIVCDSEIKSTFKWHQKRKYKTNKIRIVKRNNRHQLYFFQI